MTSQLFFIIFVEELEALIYTIGRITGLKLGLHRSLQKE